jgi:hypothetical protein
VPVLTELKQEHALLLTNFENISFSEFMYEIHAWGFHVASDHCSPHFYILCIATCLSVK